MQGDRVRLTIGWTIPSRSSTSAGCFACKQDSERDRASGIRLQYWTAPTGLRRARQCSRKGGCAVHQLAHSWLQERLAGANFYPSPNCPIKLSCLGFQSERERNSCLSTIPIAVLQKPLICKKCSTSTLVSIWHGLLCDYRTYYEDWGGFKRCPSTENHAKSNNFLQKLISIYTDCEPKSRK